MAKQSKLQQMANAFSVNNFDVQNNLDTLERSFDKLDKQIEAMYMDLLNQLDIVDGDLVSSQDMNKIYSFINKEYNGILKNSNYMDIFGNLYSVKNDVYSLHRTYNGIEVPDNGTFNSFLDAANTEISKGNVMWNKTPIIQSLNRAVLSEISITKLRKNIDDWIDGQQGNVLGVQIKKFKTYAGQIARDSVFQARGAINEQVGQMIDATQFLYVGGLVRDSRPICKHLVDKETNDYDDLPNLIAKYPDGLYPGTNKSNFTQLRGGYNCLHEVIPYNDI
jgi:hypothetical protein